MMSSAARKNIRIVLRYDDYSSLSPTAFEEKLIETLRAHGTSCAFGVIPFACRDQLDPEGTDRAALGAEKGILLARAIRAGLVEPMLHGYAHRTRPRPPGSHPAELVGLGPERQRELLEEGRFFLEELLQAEIRIYAPPWNSYDRSTLEALRDLGIEGLCAGPRFGPVLDEGSLWYLPSTSLLTSFWDVVDEARAAKDPDPLIVALFHAYDFSEVDPESATTNLAELSRTLERIAAEDDLEVVSMASLRAAGEDLGARRYALHSSLKHSRRRLLPALRRFYQRPSRFYLSARHAATRRRYNLGLLGAFYCATFLFSAFFIYLGTLLTRALVAAW